MPRGYKFTKCVTEFLKFRETLVKLKVKLPAFDTMLPTATMQAFMADGNAPLRDFLKKTDAACRAVLAKYRDIAADAGAIPAATSVVNSMVGGGINCFGVPKIIQESLKPVPGDTLRYSHAPHTSMTQVWCETMALLVPFPWSRVLRSLEALRRSSDEGRLLSLKGF